MKIDLKNKKPYLMKIPPEEFLLPGARSEQETQRRSELGGALGRAEALLLSEGSSFNLQFRR